MTTNQLIRTRKGSAMIKTTPWVRLAIGAAVAAVLTVGCMLVGVGVDHDQLLPYVQFLGGQ